MSMKKVQILVFILYALLSTSFAATTVSSTSDETGNSTENKSHTATKVLASSSLVLMNCKPAPSSQCEQCAGGSHSGRPGCETTGKHQLHLCENSDYYDDDSKNLVEAFQSCKRTRLDEDYLMMRLQGLCMVLAFLSLRNVKREKVSNESLFDQRKRIAQMGNSTANGSAQNSVHQEMVPLKNAIGQESFGDEETGMLTDQNFSLHSLSQGSEPE